MDNNRAFSGYALNAVDAKGRVSVPSDFRDLILKRCRALAHEDESVSDKQISVLLHEDCDHLVAYDAAGVRQLSQDLTASVADLPAMERRRALADLASEELGSLTLLSVDANGRLVLPETLRMMIGVTKHALFWGNIDSFEIWDPMKARAAFASRPRKRAMLETLLQKNGLI